MCSLSSYKQRERRECGYSRRFYRLNVYTTNLYPPTGNLDSTNTQVVVKLLRHFTDRMDKTILFVTHNMELTKECDRVIRVKDGRIIDG